MSARMASPFFDTLRDKGVLAPARAEELQSRAPAPWWLAVMQGIAAWIAALMIMSSFFGPLLLLGDGPIGRGLGGAGLVVAAVWLFRRGSLFTGQMALAFSLAGQALLISVVAEGFDAHARIVAAFGALFAAAMMAPPSTGLHRTACALLVLGCGAVLVGPGSGLAIYGLGLAAVAAACWLLRTEWTASSLRVKPWGHAATLMAIALAWMVSVQPTLGTLLLTGSTAEAPAPWPALYPAGAAILLVAVVAWLLRAAVPSHRAAGVLAAAAYAAAAWSAPGLLVSATLLLATFHACHRPWIGICLLAALLYLGQFYYSLESSLLAKSAALAATGLVLLALRAGLRHWRRIES